MIGRNRRNFIPKIRLEAAQPVLDQHYTVAAVTSAINAGKSTMDKWVRELSFKITHSFTHDTRAD